MQEKESLQVIKNPSIHEAIAATTTLENWFRRKKPMHGWRQTIRDIRHTLRQYRDYPEEKETQ